MDMLQRARGLFDGADGDGSRQDALCSIAAALIAQAEARRPRFVQIAGRAFDPSEIARVDDDPGLDLITVYFRHQSSFYLTNEQCAPFRAWWNEHASIERLDTAARQG